MGVRLRPQCEGESAPPHPADTLERVGRLPLYEYNFIGGDPGSICRGPMAQDWHALFPAKKDPLGIDTMDLDGMTLAAVQGLLARMNAQEATIREMRAQMAQLLAIVGDQH